MLTSGFHHRGEVHLPIWSQQLYAPYWRIRVEGRDKSKRRKSYREVEKIKLQLVESGHCPELVNAICKYLANYRKTSASEVQKLLANPNPQLSLFCPKCYLT
ncbi:MAG: hypothetical protein Q8M10_06765 [Methylotenera sp.]|uniref:hypothetical protein n=1 Tax=Methylotenera sp. TaxID=2051956 RepID=UPI0027314F88|nr:hypothetical protein [Methylotenera sp.]MDP1522842.1 hypothetical protein [Methylotenera sp.]